jgi:hypothetical protein
MSTKNLSRTVIEGGRDGYSKFKRRYSHSRERSHAHRLERELCSQREPDDAVFEPLERAYRGFADKLGPARRWLRSQVGRPWNKVRSELFARFDTRTTAGRHILFCHLLRDVAMPGDALARYADFRISAHGLLQYHGREYWRSWQRRAPLPEPERELRAWLGTRRVMVHGERSYWLVPTEHGAFRQQRELSAQEHARFCRLPAWFTESFVGAVRLVRTR